MKIKILIPVLFMFFSIGTTLEAQNKTEVNSLQANTLLQKDSKLIVLDVRTAEEFKEGHIKGALNIDIRQEDAFRKIDKLDKNAKYLVYCRTNHRSGMAVDHMIQSGFKHVYQMMDGFPGWAANKLAVQK
jgi:phage shock protein E